jgi:hypothetical protein
MSPENKEPRFTPIANPYIVGNPVRNPAMFYGRDHEFDFVRKRFLASDRGGLLVFCGERRSGKTSILFQIMAGRLGSGFIPVLIDMQAMAIDNEADFLQKIVDEIIKVLRDEGKSVPSIELGHTSQPSAAFHQFIESIVELYPSKKPILLFDEYELFEKKIEGGVLSEDVLYILSHLMERYSVFLIFTGSQYLEQRHKDYWKILGRSQFQRISFLQHEDAMRLMHEPSGGAIQYKEGADEQIFRLTAGQPFYTQAICQNLVDILNDAETREASPEIIDKVVDGVAENPFPQMVFMWEAMDRDEKFVLGLLAEQLKSEDDYATEKELTRLCRHRKYPIEMEAGRVAVVLEKLFNAELLIKDKRVPAGYAFRMDLWRHWVRRMHTVWQVMREEGLQLRRSVPWYRRKRTQLAFLLVVLVGLLWWKPPFRPEAPARTEEVVPTAAATASVRIDTEGATIFKDGSQVDVGNYSGSIAVGTDHQFRVWKAGHVDSVFTVRANASEDSLHYRIRLQEARGGVRIVTQPPGALVSVNGNEIGQAPLEVRDLSAARAHSVTASLAGYRNATRSVPILADTTVELTMDMARAMKQLVVATAPTRAELTVDGEPSGESPQVLRLSHGNHRITASMPGYVLAETTLVVNEDLERVEIQLSTEPDSYVSVSGRYSASIYLDGELLFVGVKRTGEQKVSSGAHEITVVLGDGTRISETIELGVGERVVCEFDGNSIRITDRTGGVAR